MAYTVAALIVLFDQITKALVEANIALGSQRPLIDGFAYLVHAQNTGAAWSLFAECAQERRGWRDKMETTFADEP